MKINVSFTILCVSLLGWACNERVDGCLDIQAENFAFDADVHDPSLCVYPNLVLNVSYQWDTVALRGDSLYRSDAGMDFVVHAVQILFSDFRIDDTEGVTHSVEDRVIVRVPPCTDGPQEEIVDDFVFVDRTAFNYAIGGFRPSGHMTEGSVLAGVAQAYCQESFTAAHPLRSARAGYREASGDFALGRFVISLDSLNAERDTFYVYRTSEQLNFPIDRTFRRGVRDTLFMEIDFSEILMPVDWEAEESVIAATIGEKITAAVRIR